MSFDDDFAFYLAMPEAEARALLARRRSETIMLAGATTFAAGVVASKITLPAPPLTAGARIAALIAEERCENDDAAMSRVDVAMTLAFLAAGLADEAEVETLAYSLLGAVRAVEDGDACDALWDTLTDDERAAWRRRSAALAAVVRRLRAGTRDGSG